MNKAQWLERVSEISCVICGARPVEIHHPEIVRNDLSDYYVAALCADCHRGPIGVHGMHRMPFEKRTKRSAEDLVKLTLAEVIKRL